MEIRIKTKNLILNPKLEKFILDKLKNLQKFFPKNAIQIIDVEIGITTFHHQKGNIYSAEIQTETPTGNLLRAYSEKEKIETAILDAKEGLEVQLMKFKEKLDRRKKIKNKNCLTDF
ncbi:MAG TPA: ribosome-associated translation inhibitor RaiA [Candidatus Pacearchaeota archaeon]|jgi:ribosomal subunit interface protein|nr:ribosome-associated translation inhibitor RaiA [Candidatus Pacearchaeota archaeon]HPC37481.1 ribosome-associated translation inhibitor RaiA [Candidatus Paceibacterota bacterium]HQG09130.1 ribosome-associated translation inhibitor RaiA [Candidatus Pacearchaeota archaeon]HQH20119.1 ribosome-associated translation inhibitor RaiA [Candidatus Pacearchaeota archaeon]HQK58596.1 ribosome-associated translation inhibitor RaiA [Candidatus Pacearchaeota archaeon]